ncbi:undecaprenyl-phosphate galactose phosphotransferase WbaP [Vibrio sp. S4M6]|uniref:undecaprenyl-phosphate galactose phosphotransferase WbaP n=1 Tax=Vibrio sinus TaxID=2946865 RepID=UPI00202A8ECF|nr:undecaprenyl-phosphate galactose phosphotransferase WbaP [Vibrio sinus]MCL9781315.1 undecaprenyl-phosphate galactose phosphotransferase WbaP [Vibrio sinus]
MLTDRVEHSRFINQFGLMLADIIGFVLAFSVTHGIMLVTDAEHAMTYNRWQNMFHGYQWFVSSFGLMLLGMVVFSLYFRHYRYRKPFWSELKQVIITMLSIAVLNLVLVSLIDKNISHDRWTIFWGLAIVSIPLSRSLMKRILRFFGLWQWPTFIIGCGQNAREAYLAIESEKRMGFDVIAFIAPDEGHYESPIKGVPLLRIEAETLTNMKNAQLFIALEHTQYQLCDFWLRKLASNQLRNISLIPSLRGIPLHGTDISHFFRHEALILQVRNNLTRSSAQVMKRGFDVVVSFLLLIILSPIMLFIGWKVSRDGGAPTYGHERIGQHGEKFKCLKFRSMISNSEEVLQELLDRDPEARAEWEKDFKLKNDPRITPIGHFIRKTSLDELPQLWCVLKGEMSLVGPRPIVQKELEQYYGENSDYYLMAKPGMTGLWQVSGRNDVDYDTRIYLDGWYVKNWSMWYDIAMLFKTVGVVLRSDGAY